LGYLEISDSAKHICNILTVGIGAEKVVNGVDGIRNKLFKNIMKQEVAYFNQTTTGVLVSRFANDAERVKRLLQEFFPGVIEAIAMVRSPPYLDRVW